MMGLRGERRRGYIDDLIRPVHSKQGVTDLADA
jgi:hypothetical protein